MSGEPAGRKTQPAKFFLILSTLIFIAWVGAMIAMYVTTVYPQRYPATAPSAITAR